MQDSPDQIRPRCLPASFQFSCANPWSATRPRKSLSDSINEYQQSMPGEDFLALHMHELLAYCRSQRGSYYTGYGSGWNVGTHHDIAA